MQYLPLTGFQDNEYTKFILKLLCDTGSLAFKPKVLLQQIWLTLINLIKKK